MMLVRRLVAATAALATAGAVLTACGATGNDDEAATAPAVQIEEGALPATLDHKFGQTTIEEAPARVVSLGYNDQDALLALGVTPVAVREWSGMAPEGEVAGEWASGKVEGDKPEVYSPEEIDPEAIAAMDPDLIVASYAGLDQATYDALSEIAPVVVQKGEYEDYQQPWDVTTREIGKAVGKPAAADSLVGEVEKKFADLAAKHPEWKGKTVTVATYDGEALSAFASKDMRTRFFTSLGFEPTAEIDRTAGSKFYAEFSLEEARRVDADVLVWDQLSYAPEGRATIEQQSALAALPAVADKRSVFLEGTLEKAFGWQTVLSISYVLDHIEGELEPVVTE